MRSDVPSWLCQPAGRRAWPRVAILCVLLAAPVKGERAPPPQPSGDAGALADMSLEDLMNLRIESVVSASRYEQKVTQAPASVTLVTASTWLAA